QLRRRSGDESSAMDSTGSRKEGPSKWARLRVSIDRLGDRVFVAGEWLWVEDCTADLLLAYAGEQEARAASLISSADRASEIAEALKRGGFATVKEWDVASRAMSEALAA